MSFNKEPKRSKNDIKAYFNNLFQPVKSEMITPINLSSTKNLISNSKTELSPYKIHSNGNKTFLVDRYVTGSQMPVHYKQRIKSFQTQSISILKKTDLDLSSKTYSQFENFNSQKMSNNQSVPKKIVSKRENQTAFFLRRKSSSPPVNKITNNLDLTNHDKKLKKIVAFNRNNSFNLASSAEKNFSMRNTTACGKTKGNSSPNRENTMYSPISDSDANHKQQDPNRFSIGLYKSGNADGYSPEKINSKNTVYLHRYQPKTTFKKIEIVKNHLKVNTGSNSPLKKKNNMKKLKLQKENTYHKLREMPRHNSKTFTNLFQKNNNKDNETCLSPPIFEKDLSIAVRNTNNQLNPHDFSKSQGNLGKNVKLFQRIKSVGNTSKVIVSNNQLFENQRESTSSICPAQVFSGQTRVLEGTHTRTKTITTGITSLEDPNLPDQQISKMKLCDLFDEKVFVKHLKTLQNMSNKKSYIDKISYLRGLNKSFYYDYSLQRVEPLLRKFIENLKRAVQRKKQSKNEIASYFLLNEMAKNTNVGNQIQLKRQNPIGAPKQNIQENFQDWKQKNDENKNKDSKVTFDLINNMNKKKIAHFKSGQMDSEIIEEEEIDCGTDVRVNNIGRPTSLATVGVTSNSDGPGFGIMNKTRPQNLSRGGISISQKTIEAGLAVKEFYSNYDNNELMLKQGDEKLMSILNNNEICSSPLDDINEENDQSSVDSEDSKNDDMNLSQIDNDKEMPSTLKNNPDGSDEQDSNKNSFDFKKNLNTGLINPITKRDVLGFNQNLHSKSTNMRFTAPDIRNNVQKYLNKNNQDMLNESIARKENELLDWSKSRKDEKLNNQLTKAAYKVAQLGVSVPVIANLGTIHEDDFSPFEDEPDDNKASMGNLLENDKKVNQDKSWHKVKTIGMKPDQQTRKTLMIRQDKKCNQTAPQLLISGPKKKGSGREQIQAMIKNFLLEYPEARTIFIGESHNDQGKLINSPRQLKQKMNNYIKKRNSKSNKMGGILRNVLNQCKLKTKRKMTYEIKMRQRKEKKDPALKQYQYQDDKLDIFDIIEAKENLICDLISFLFKQNNLMVTDNFFMIDKFSGYMSHLLGNFEELCKLAYVDANKDHATDKNEKLRLDFFQKNYDKVSMQTIDNHNNPKDGKIVYYSKNMKRFKNTYTKFESEDMYNQAISKPIESDNSHCGDNHDQGVGTFKNKESDEENNIIRSIRFSKLDQNHKISSDNDIHNTEGSMGDVDELKYDNLYTKSIVLRRKIDYLKSVTFSESGKLRKILDKMVEEIAELSDHISLTFCKYLKISTK